MWFGKKKREPEEKKGNPNIFIHKTASLGKGGFVLKSLYIDKYSYVCDNAKIYCDCQIGKYSSISQDLTLGPGQHPKNFLSTHPFQFIDSYFVENASKKFPLDLYKPVEIGNDVWIGINVTIQNDVTINDGAIVGSGAVVTKDVEPYAIVGGIPAKVLKYRFNDGITKALRELEWWNLDEEFLKNLPFNNVKECIRQITDYKLSK